MSVVYYKNSKNILDPLIHWDDLQLLYVSYNNKNETLVPTAVHRHEENLEIQYICGGRGHIRVGRRLFEVQAGDIMIYNQGVLHDEAADPHEGMWFYNCGVRGLSLPKLEDNCLLSKDVAPRMHTGDLSEEIRVMFHLLYKEVENNLPKNGEVTHSLLMTLLQIILYQLPHERQPHHKEKDKMLIACKDYIDAHYTEELTVEGLAEFSHMSVSGFAHQFKKIFGFPPIQYIIRRRIGKAQTLLLSTDLSITEISLSVGYDNISYFNNQFKRFTSMSPQAYRKYKVGERQYKKLRKLNPLAGGEASDF